MQVPYRKYHPPVHGNVGTYNPDSIVHHRTIDFINRTPFHMVVVDRNAIPISLPPAPSGTDLRDPGVEVRVCYSFYAGQGYKHIRDCIEYIGNFLKDNNDERSKILEATIEHSNETTGGFRIIIRRHIRQQDITEYKAVYDSATDFMFCFENAYLTFVHPESKEGRNNKDLTDYVNGRPNGRLIEIVDNNKEIRERFVFSANSVIRIPTVQDKTRDNGIYVTSVIDNGMSVSDVDTKRYGFEEGSALFGLFVTREDAMTNGNPERISKLNVAEREKELQELKTSYAKREAEVDAERLEIKAMQTRHEAALEKERSDRKIEIDKLTDELNKKSAERKDHYEEKSYQRKDNSETIKIISAVVGGFIAAALLFFRR